MLNAPSLPFALFIQFFISLAAIAYCVLVYFHREYLPRFNMLTVAVTLFFAVLGLSVLTSQDPMISFRGLSWRMVGFATMIHFWLLFVIASSVFRSWEDWIRIFRVATVACFLVLFYTYFVDLRLNIFEFFRREVGSTFYNVGIFSSYLLLNVPIIAIFVSKSSGHWRTFGYVTLVITVLTLLFTINRASIVGLVFGGLVGFTLFAILSKKSLYRKAAVGVWLALALFAGGLFLIRDNPFMERFPRLQERLTTFDSADANISARFLAWRMAWAGFLDYPVTGWGLQNYRLATDRYFNPSFTRYVSTEIWSDNPHNTPLQLLAETGIGGLVAYVFIFAAALTVVWRSEHFSLVHRCLLTGLLAGYFVQNLFIFDRTITFFFFFLLLAFFSSQSAVSRRLPSWTSAFALPSAAVLFFGFLFATLQPAYAATLGKQCYREIDVGKCDRAIAMAPFLEEETVYQMTNLSAGIVRSGHEPDARLNGFLRATMDKAHILAEKTPLYARHFYNAAMTGYYVTSLDQIGDDYLDVTKEWFTRTLDRVPYRLEVYSYFGDFLLREFKDYDGAIALLERALAIDERFAQGHWTLGMVLAEKGEYARGLAEIERAFYLGHTGPLRDPFWIRVLADIYEKSGNKENAAVMRQKAAEIEFYRSETK